MQKECLTFTLPLKDAWSSSLLPLRFSSTDSELWHGQVDLKQTLFQLIHWSSDPHQTGAWTESPSFIKSRKVSILGPFAKPDCHQINSYQTAWCVFNERNASGIGRAGGRQEIHFCFTISSQSYLINIPCCPQNQVWALPHHPTGWVLMRPEAVGSLAGHTGRWQVMELLGLAWDKDVLAGIYWW